MKKKLVSTSLAVALGFSSLGVVPAAIKPIEVSAATVNVYNNQQAVDAKADELIRIAKSLIGKATYSDTEYKRTYPYKFSCATFLDFIFKQAGIDIATYNEDYMIKQGTYVPRDQLQKGDLVFFRSKTTGTDPDHVGMYIGDNKVIHMANPKQDIIIADMNSKPYYTESYLSARRVLPTLLSANPATKGDSIVEDSFNLMNKATMGSVNNPGSLKFTKTGFLDHVYKQNGVTLGTTNMADLMKRGTTVSRDNLKKGDIVFFSSTVGSKTPYLAAIYAGDQRLIIPSSSSVFTRVMLYSWYDQRFITAKRFFTEAAPAPAPAPVEKPAATVTKADKVVSLAESLIGKAKFGYVYNENTLTFTGAGFTYYVYKNQGIDLKSKIASSQSKLGQAVQKSSLQKGDLIFFSRDNSGEKITQAGIYMGGNQYIMLSTSGSVVKGSLDSTWAKQNYVKASRVL